MEQRQPKRRRNTNIIRLFASSSSSSSNDDDDDFVGADDLPAVQGLFSKYCDEDGLMNKDKLVKMKPFSAMLVSFALYWLFV